MSTLGIKPQPVRVPLTRIEPAGRPLSTVPNNKGISSTILSEFLPTLPRLLHGTWRPSTETDSPEEVQEGRGKGMESRPKWPENTGSGSKGQRGLHSRSHSQLPHISQKSRAAATRDQPGRMALASTGLSLWNLRSGQALGLYPCPSQPVNMAAKLPGPTASRSTLGPRALLPLCPLPCLFISHPGQAVCSKAGLSHTLCVKSPLPFTPPSSGSLSTGWPVQQEVFL